eukprot:Opistho-2@80195
MSTTPDRFLGVQRKSLKTNPLLTKSKLGQPKPPVGPLPPSDHVYGIPNPSNAGGAKEVLTKWSQQQRKPDSMPPLDYVTINKCSVKDGALTTREQAEYRKNHEIRVKVGPAARKDKDDGALSDQTFGITRRSSTPIKALLANQYQRQWLDDQKKTQDDKEASKKKIVAYSTSTTSRKAAPRKPRAASR